MDDDEKNRRFTVFLYTIHSNVYPTFNSALRERPPGARFDAWRPFLWHLMAVLRSLPDINRTVYRGIDTNDPRYHGPPLTDYKMSAKIHWSGFSSTTIEPSVARNGFAGVGGVVFIMKVHNAKDSACLHQHCRCVICCLLVSYECYCVHSPTFLLVWQHGGRVASQPEHGISCDEGAAHAVRRPAARLQCNRDAADS